MSTDHTLGDGPIQAEYREQMQLLAELIDNFFNPKTPKKTGFVLMLFPFNDFDGRCNYISNASRKDITILLREQLARFEGMPEGSGTA